MLQVLTSDKEVMTRFYEPWASIRSRDDMLPLIVNVMQPLSRYPYQLSLDYELTKWDLH